MRPDRPSRRWGGLSPRAVGTGLAVLAFLVGLVLFLSARAEDTPEPTETSPTATSSAGCFAHSCQGQDPRATGCDQDVETLDQTVLQGMLIQLRFSTRCGAAWGRITHAAVGDVVEVHNSAGQRATARVRTGVDVYTPMVDANGTVTAWACGHLSQAPAYKCTRHL